MSERSLPEELRTGVAEIDVEHGLQLGLVEDFRSAVAAGMTGHQAAAILQRLEDYTNAHFLGEQLLMRQHAYPGYEAHQQEHDRLVDALRTLRESWASGGQKAGVASAAMVHHWFSEHVRTLDQALARFLTEKGASA
jgi:hemerythrin-like metal-binding protein